MSVTEHCDPYGALRNDDNQTFSPREVDQVGSGDDARPRPLDTGTYRGITQLFQASRP
jgi:hypothetical protein